MWQPGGLSQLPHLGQRVPRVYMAPAIKPVSVSPLLGLKEHQCLITDINVLTFL